MSDRLQLPRCPRGVIFDMDGLLVDTEPVWGEVEDDLIARHGKTLTSDVRRPLMGMRMVDFWTGMSQALEINEPVDLLIAEVVADFLSRLPDEAVARPGANELIAYLVQRKMPIAIASSSPMAIINGVVSARGWDKVFPVRVTGDEVPNGKPAPDVYLEAAHRLGLPPADCLALEDSLNGARAAVAAGMVTIAVPDPSHTTAADFVGITPYVAASLHEVVYAVEADCAQPA